MTHTECDDIIENEATKLSVIKLVLSYQGIYREQKVPPLVEEEDGDD